MCVHTVVEKLWSKHKYYLAFQSMNHYHPLFANLNNSFVAFKTVCIHLKINNSNLILYIGN